MCEACTKSRQFKVVVRRDRRRRPSGGKSLLAMGRGRGVCSPRATPACLSADSVLPSLSRVALAGNTCLRSTLGQASVTRCHHPVTDAFPLF